MDNTAGGTKVSNFLLNPRQYFVEAVENGLNNRRLKTYPAVQVYLVDLLEHYLDARNLFENGDETFAETFLKASQSEEVIKREMMKKLGDRALYLTGFFGDSFERKLIDVDYYADIGVAAYGTLAETAREDRAAQVYRVFSRQFVDFVDVLTYISQQSMVNSDESILRLYDRFLRTGSELARQRLNEMGVITVPKDQHRKDIKT